MQVSKPLSATSIASAIAAAGNVLDLGSTGSIKVGTLRLWDSNASHSLNVVCDSNLAANRGLLLRPGDATRTITMNGDRILGSGGDPWTDCINGNTGVVSTGTPMAFTGGSLTAGTGVKPGRACHMVRMHVHAFLAAATTNGQADFTVTVYKNASTGSGARVLEVTFTDVNTATPGLMATTTTILNSGLDAFNGSTDYYTVMVTITGSTSVSLAPLRVLLEGTID